MRTGTLSLMLMLMLGFALVACGDDDGGPTDSGGVADSGQDDAMTGEDAGSDATTADAGVCDEVTTVPETVDSDLTIGPGCVRINRTNVRDDATLTIAPGTTVLMASGGFLDISPFGDGSALVAVGTEAAPIVFTSDSVSPLAGDWQCVRITGSSSASEVQYTTFEYGGAACDTTGAGYEGMLQLNAGARAVSNNTFRHSSTHGVWIQTDGGVRGFANNSFADNALSSIRVAAPQLLVLGTGLTFADADDRIDIDNTFALEREGTWLGQPVPFRSIGALAIRDNTVTMGAGLTLQMNGSSVDVFTGNLIVEGTEAAPVTITSSASAPIKGDWGCISFSSLIGTPRFDHAIIEYAGNGSGCGGGSSFNTAISATDQSPIITNSTFRHIAGSAIRSIPCDMNAAWCMNTFEDVDTGPLECGFGRVPTACL